MSDVSNIFQGALAALNKGDLRQGEMDLRRVVQIDGSHVPALNILSVIMMKLERFSEAEVFVSRAVALDQRSDVSFYNFGLISRKLGKPGPALEHFSRALELNPNVAETWNSRGAVFNDLEKYENAISDFDRAIAIEPTYAEAYSNKGKSLYLTKRYDDAISAYDKALSIKSDLPEAWLGRGSVLSQLNRHEEALAACDKVLSVRPDFAEMWLSRGSVLSDLKRYDDALSALNRALSIRPEFAEAWFGRGSVLSDLRRYDDALSAFDRALSFRPDFAEVWLGRGSVLGDLRRYDDGLSAFDRALSIKPDLAKAWLGRGNLLIDLKRYDEALSDLDRALSIKADLAEAWLGRGNALNDLKRYDEAFAAYDKALSVKPDLAKAWLGRGSALGELKRYDEAYSAYAEAQRLQPNLAEAHFNEGFQRLLLGDLERGWDKYEYRWDTRQYLASKPRFAQPLWLGDCPIRDKVIFLHSEQGLGDTIMACRYVPMVAALGARVILEVKPALASLCRGLEGLSHLVVAGDAVPEFDYHCPLMTLPLAFKTRLETIPANVPYFRLPPDKIEHWRQRLGQARFKIGVGWAGNPDFPKDHNRSILLRNILPILSVPGAQYFSIQKDLRDGDEEVLSGMPDLVHLGPEIGDFQDTAAIMSSLDLVISSDTSTVNLAGALGRPVWILLAANPDWRWLLDRSDSPWYPTARLFRQNTSGEWGTVVYEARSALEELLRRDDPGSGRPG